MLDSDGGRGSAIGLRSRGISIIATMKKPSASTVPSFADDVHDVAGLARIGECLLGAQLPSARVRADAGAREAEDRPG